MKFLFYYSLFIGIIFLTFQIYLYFRKRNRGEGEIQTSCLGKESWMALVVIFLMKAALIILLLSTGFTTIWHDDVIRWLMALSWKSHPWFAPNDHVWLGMSFYIYGLSMKIISNPLIATRSANIFISLSSLFSIYYLTSRLFNNQKAGIGAAIILCFIPVHTYLSVMTMSDLIYIVFMGFSIGAFLSYIFWFRKGDIRKAKIRLILICFSCLGLTSTRYEGWVLTGCLGLAFIIHWFWKNAKRKGVGWFWFVLILLFMVLYPILWIISSWVVLDHPLAFFKNQSKLNEIYASQYNKSNTLSEKLLRYPQELERQYGGLIFLSFAGLICSLIQYKKKPILAIGASVSLLYIILMEISAIIGGTSMGLNRCILYFIFLLIPFLAAPFIFLIEKRREVSKLLIIAGILLLFYPVASYLRINFHETFNWKSWEWNSDTICITRYIQFELHNQTDTKHLKKEERILVWYKKGDASHILIPKLCSNNQRIILENSENLHQHWLNQRDLLIISHMREIRNSHWSEVQRFGDYRFYRFTKSQGEEHIKSFEGWAFRPQKK